MEYNAPQPSATALGCWLIAVPFFIPTQSPANRNVADTDHQRPYQQDAYLKDSHRIPLYVTLRTLPPIFALIALPLRSLELFLGKLTPIQTPPGIPDVGCHYGY